MTKGSHYSSCLEDFGQGILKAFWQQKFMQGLGFSWQ